VFRHLIDKIAATPLSSTTPHFAELEDKRKKISALASSNLI
jgi:hypothetical protein